MGEQFADSTKKEYPPGIIGPFSLQSVVTPDLNMTVYDISGKELFTSIIASNTYSIDIDVSKFYPGIYIIKVNDAVMSRSVRFIKEWAQRISQLAN